MMSELLHFLELTFVFFKNTDEEVKQVQLSERHQLLTTVCKYSLQNYRGI